MCGCEYFVKDTHDKVLLVEPMCTHAFCTQSVPSDDDIKQRESVRATGGVVYTPSSRTWKPPLSGHETKKN